jgi:hypothetical protein
MEPRFVLDYIGVVMYHKSMKTTTKANPNEIIRLLKSKRQSFSWGSSYAEKFTPEAKAWYDRSANILFSGVPYLSTAQVLAVYDDAIKHLEIWDDLDCHGAPSHAELRHSGGH